MATPTLTEKLRLHPLLSELPSETLLRLASRGRLRTLRRNERFIQEGNNPEAYWVLLKGSIRIFYTSDDGGEVTVKLLQAPAACGELELLTRRAHVESCCSLEPSEVFELPAAGFEVLLESPAFTSRVLTDVAHRFLIAAQNERALSFLNVSQRLANMLRSYVRLYGIPVDGGTGFRIRFSQTDLADDLGAARRSVTRILRDWQKLGVLSWRRGGYVIHREDLLARFATPELSGIDYRLAPTAPTESSRTGT